MIKDILINSINEAISSLSFESGEVHLEHPADLEHGDYSTNIAFVLAKKEGRKPKDLAEEIARYIEQNIPENVERIEVAGAGFINFYLSKEFFAESINKILKERNKWGSNKLQDGKKVIVEYTDPNPFKEFHIGHLMSNAIGESISRLIEFSGAEVKRANYQGDVGLHVAKAIWALRKSKLGPNMIVYELDSITLGKAYAEGASAYESDEKVKEEIKEINKKIYDKDNTLINAIYNRGRTVSFEHFEEIYKKLGTKFDEYFFESETGPVGKKIVEENIGKVFEESDGAVIFKGEKYGLHTRVFINSEGLPTYEAKDLGLAKIKSGKFDYGQSIVVTGNEVKEYFKVILEAMSLIYPELAEKTKHISHGMLRLPRGKMSSRTGDIVTAESLIDEVKKRVLEKMKDSDIKDKAKTASGSFKEETAEEIAVGAIKYSILKQSAGKDIIFDFEKSLSFEGDSGPYLQYSHTRAQSILEKAQAEKINSVGNPRIKNAEELEKLLYRFPEVVERASKEFEPHYIVIYLTEVAWAFNSFYTKERIIEESETSQYKITLTKAFASTIKNGLWLLGIKAPLKM